MRENYKDLLAPVRQRVSSRGPRSMVEEYESDRSRILYSAAFRRLQRKTQVFPLEENAAVRSRLTHSLEVAHVGRYIATSVVEKIDKKKFLTKYKLGPDERLALANVVDTACLAHDIGNPPFGHFGEAAIAKWADSFVSKKLKNCQSGFDPKVIMHDDSTKDFTVFDGNPQGFRIVCSLAGVDGYGMNLTAAQLASLVKYPCGAGGMDKDNPILKKAGIFSSEMGSWAWVRDKFGLAERARFPLAFLMEAADDISYCLSDIEDGIEKCYTTHDDFYGAVHNLLVSEGKSTALLDESINRANEKAQSVERTVFLRTMLVRALVDEAAEAYVQKHSEIFEGKATNLLDASSDHYILLSAIRRTVGTKLYGRRASVELELTGYAAILGILNKYEDLIDLSSSDFDRLGGSRVTSSLIGAQRLYSLLPPKYLAAYRRSCESISSEEVSWCHRVRLVIDFVSGMTDVFALQTYQILTGVK